MGLAQILLGPKVLDLEGRGDGVGSAPSLTTELLEQACTANGLSIERFNSQCKHLCLLEQKKAFTPGKDFNSHKIFLSHQHGRRFIVLEHENGRCDVM